MMMPDVSQHSAPLDYDHSTNDEIPMRPSRLWGCASMVGALIVGVILGAFALVIAFLALIGGIVFAAFTSLGVKTYIARNQTKTTTKRRHHK